MKKTIILKDEKKEVLAGLRKINDLYKELSLNPCSNWLYLDKPDDIDIPLLPDDYIIIRGGERIVIGKVNNKIGQNPTVRNPIHFIFNGKKIETNFKTAKLKGQDISNLDKELKSIILFADLEGSVDAFIQSDLTLVIQESDSYFTIPSNDNDGIDLEECAKKNRKPPKGQKLYKIKIDGEKHKVKKEKMTGTQILGLIGKTYDEWSLNQKFCGGRRIPIKPEDFVDFTQKGIERFETVRKQAQQGLL
ncbi:MAG: multiubiquitin domain-containing protein [Bdellovibrionales bacterium]|nr:multiubiquitin domain-containing protein [Bdellovibrionales bacterium]